MQIVRILALLILTGVSLIAHAEFKTICTKGGAVRKVEIIYENPVKKAPCKVMYHKKGEDPTGEAKVKMLWNSPNNSTFCEIKAAEFVKKLEAMEFVCKENKTDTSHPK